jgi:hypothetical protein
LGLAVAVASVVFWVVEAQKLISRRCAVAVGPPPLAQAAANVALAQPAYAG